MTIYYVDDDGSNTSPYDTWAKAATTLAVVDSVAAAGDLIYVASDTHEANTSVSLDFSNGTQANPVKIISVNKSTDVYETGADIGNSGGTASLSLAGNFAMYGLTLRTGNVCRLGNGAEKAQRFEDCTFSGEGNYPFNGGFAVGADYQDQTNPIELRNCTIDFTLAGASDRYIKVNCNKEVRFIGCTFTGGAAAGFVKETGYYLHPRVIFEACDLSDVTSLVQISSDMGYVRAERCKLNASWTTTNGTKLHSHVVVDVVNCEDGTISVPPLGINERWTFWGTVKSTLARYRTGGATDGEQANEYSWEMASNSDALETYHWIESPPLIRWVDAGASQTITVYVASGGTLNDDDLWIEVISPNETASPNQTALGNFQTTRADPLATPAALTTDSGSTWNGTGVGTKQKITVTISPTEAGPVSVRCFLAKPSTTVYVDPKIEVT